MSTRPDLSSLRGEIERIDAGIIALIAERVRLARQVGDMKQAAGVATLDHAREAAVVRRAVELGREHGLGESDEIRQVFWQLIGLCRRAQAREPLR